MNKYAIPQSKILQYIYFIGQSEILSQQETQELIRRATEFQQDLTYTFMRFEHQPNLQEQIINLVRSQKSGKPDQIHPSKSFGDEITSPLGTFLLNRKKQQQKYSTEFKITLEGNQVLEEDQENYI